MSRIKEPPNFADLKAQLTSALRRTSVSPSIFGYRPQLHQENFHRSEKIGRLFLGGNRAGKTVAGAAETVMWLTGKHPYWQKFKPPIRARAVGVDFDNGVNRIMKPEIARWIPPSELINGSWEDSYEKSSRTLTLNNGSTLEFMSYDQDVDKFAGTSRHFCVDVNTTVLTKRGWLPHTLISLGDEILTYNGNKYEWAPVELLYKAEVDEELYRITGRELDALVTADHKWVVENRKTGVESFVATKDLTTNMRIRVGANKDTQGVDVVRYAYAYLLGIYIAEGSKSNSQKSCTIAQNPGEVRNKIKYCLDTLGVEYSEHQTSFYLKNDLFAEHVNYKESLSLSSVYVKSPSYSILGWSNNARYDVFRGLMDGDGDLRTGNSYRYTTKDLCIAEFVVALSTTLGYKGNIDIDKEGYYRVHLKTKSSERYNYDFVNVASLSIRKQKYTGIVWCPGTPNKTAVFKRNNKVYLSGQCWFDEEPPEEIFNECLLRLVDVGGHWIMTMTPLIDMSWTLDRLYEKGFDGKNPNLDVFRASTTDNAYINSAILDIITEGLSDEESQARKQGLYFSYSGAIYNDVLAGAIIPPIIENDSWDLVKNKWGHFGMLDHGFTNPTAFLIGAFDGDGRIIIYDEYYAKKQTVGENAAAIKQKVADLGIQLEYIVADPSTRNIDPIVGYSIQQEYGKNGLYLSLANNDVVAGIERVYSRFKRRQLFITENCEKTLWEAQRYRWSKFANKKVEGKNNAKEQPMKKDDHAMDALRYGVVSRPQLDGEVDMKSFTLLNSDSIAISEGHPLMDYELMKKDDNVFIDPILGSEW